MSKTPGQAAYEAWGGANTLAPEVLPWEHLPEGYAQRWEAVAQAAIEAGRTPATQPTGPAVMLSFKMPFGTTMMRKQEDPAVWHNITGASAVSITRIDVPPADAFLREQITELIDDPEIDMATRELLAEILKEEERR